MDVSVGVGLAEDVTGDGQSFDGAVFEGGMRLDLGGLPGPVVGFVVPISGRMRGTTYGYLELGATLEGMIRAGPVAVGGGGALDLRIQPDSVDFSDRTDRIRQSAIMAGYSLAGRVNLWPHGLFVDARRISYVVSLANEAPQIICSTGACVELDPANLIDAAELSVGVGYTLPRKDWSALAHTFRVVHRSLYTTFQQLGDNADRGENGAQTATVLQYGVSI
jgi:hypothetical protein